MKGAFTFPFTNSKGFTYLTFMTTSSPVSCYLTVCLAPDCKLPIEASRTSGSSLLCSTRNDVYEEDIALSFFLVLSLIKLYVIILSFFGFFANRFYLFPIFMNCNFMYTSCCIQKKPISEKSKK